MRGIYLQWWCECFGEIFGMLHIPSRFLPFTHTHSLYYAHIHILTVCVVCNYHTHRRTHTNMSVITIIHQYTHSYSHMEGRMEALSLSLSLSLCLSLSLALSLSLSIYLSLFPLKFLFFFCCYASFNCQIHLRTYSCKFCMTVSGASWPLDTTEYKVFKSWHDFYGW